jgi:preprotein translocase subunit SecE
LSVFNIYKKGQGKFVRIGTALGLGLLVILGIIWVENQFLPFEPPYAQAMAALIIAAIGGGFCFYVVNKPKFADFMILTESEMNKVVWPTRAAVIRATRLVILIVFALAFLLYLVDFGFLTFFHSIHVIH